MKTSTIVSGLLLTFLFAESSAGQQVTPLNNPQVTPLSRAANTVRPQIATKEKPDKKAAAALEQKESAARERLNALQQQPEFGRPKPGDIFIDTLPQPTGKAKGDTLEGAPAEGTPAGNSKDSGMSREEKRKADLAAIYKAFEKNLITAHQYQILRDNIASAD